MRLLARISPARRLKTGVAIPAIFLATQASFAHGPEMPIARRDDLQVAGLLAISVVVGMLWQWYSPRAVGDRLIGPALAVAALPILTIFMPGETTCRPWSLIALVGLGAGVVIADMWQRIHASRSKSAAQLEDDVPR
jgi:hypothetical protein